MDLEKHIALLSQYDPIIKRVWEMYYKDGEKLPCNPKDAEYFHKKVDEYLKNLETLQERPNGK